MILEDYRFEHKSLPDSITFRLIIEKPKDLENLLEKSKQEIARHSRL